MQATQSIQPTKEQLNAGFEMVKAVAVAIKELGQVPSGELYARLCGHLSLNDYNAIITVLKNAKAIKEENYLLIWILN